MRAHLQCCLQRKEVELEAVMNDSFAQSDGQNGVQQSDYTKCSVEVPCT